MAITLQDIHAVADTIAAEGGKPTLAIVRKALGGGSFTTISEGMQAWKVKHQAQTIVTPLREAAPAAVSERLSAFGGEIWAIALELSNARLQSEREALEQVRQELAQTQQETIDLADQLNEELEQAQALIRQQAEALDKAGDEATAKSSEFASEKSARLEAERKSEIAMAGLTETHQQISAINLHINELKAENKAFRAEANENYKKAVTAESELSKTLERLSDVKAELLGRESGRHKLNADKAGNEATAKSNELESEKSARLEAERKSEIAMAGLTETHQQISALNLHINELKIENKAFRTEANENYKKAVTVESELSKTLERLSDVKAELERESERHKLNADKAATALVEKEDLLNALNHKLEIATASEIESVQAIKTLQGKMDVMKEQNELSHAYLDAIKKSK